MPAQPKFRSSLSRERRQFSAGFDVSNDMRKSNFTLMEVMIAALILALSVVATMGIVGTSRANVLREERRWSREHLFTNIAEFYLLAGPDNPLPAELLPEGYSASCELREVEDLPEDAHESIRGWRLGEFVIRLYDSSGNLLEEQFIRKLLKEEDLGYVEMGAGSHR